MLRHLTAAEVRDLAKGRHLVVVQPEDPSSQAAIMDAISLVIEGLRRLLLAGSIQPAEADQVMDTLKRVLHQPVEGGG